MDTETDRILDALPGMIWTALPDGRIDFVNRRWSVFTGLGLDHALGWEWQSAVHPDDLAGLLERWRTILTSGESGDMEVRVRRADGQHRWFVINANPMQNDKGEIVKGCGIGTDVDDLRRARQELHRRELDFQLVVDSIPLPVAVTTPSGEVEGLNRPTLDYFGKTLEELKDWKASDVVHPDDLKRTIAVQIDAHQKGSSYNVESRHRRADGVYRWYNVLGMPLRDPHGNILRWLHLLIDIDDRKRAEEALRESEREAKLIVDSIPGLVAVFGPDGEVEGLNGQFLAYLGQTREEFANWPTNGTVHPDDLARHIDTLKTSLGCGRPIDFETRLRRFDGVYRWVQIRGDAARDQAGDIVRWYCLMVDVDERKRAEDALRDSESRLAKAEQEVRLMLDSIPVLAWSALPDGSAEYFNQHYFDYVGFPHGRSEYWDLTAAVHPDDLEGLAATWGAILASGQSGEFEARLRRFDRLYRWFLFRVSPLRDEAGNIVRWYGTNTDIDDRKRAEEALKRSEAFLAEGQHLARMGNFSWHLGTGEIIWSEPLYRIFEFAPGVTMTLDLIATRVHPEDLPLISGMIERAERGDSDFEYQHRIVMPDGSIKHLHLIAHRSRDRPGQMEYIGAVLDVTRRRVTEEALGRARSELAHVARVSSLGALTASIAHEVNQPLAGIVTNASTCLRMLAADPPNVDGARETARRTIRDGNRAADVMARLRALFGKRAATVEPVDLNEATREVIALAAGDLDRGRVVLRTELAHGLRPIGGDRVQLQQVIMNLLRNAADAMNDVHDRPRRILVRTDPEIAGHVRLTVEDAGIGFGPDGPERVFEAFYTTKSDGMGIGLLVSRSIIENHNGRLWATPNDGPGATFAFAIPHYRKDRVDDYSGVAGGPDAGSAEHATGVS